MAMVLAQITRQQDRVVVAAPLLDQRRLVRLVRCELFGPAQLAHSHPQIQEICNEN
jgi:hypothetical protein